MSNDSIQNQSTTESVLLPDVVLPTNLFILPINSPIIFPTLMAPLNIQTPRFIATTEESINRQRFVGLLLSREGDVTHETQLKDLYETGVVAKILKRIKMPDGSINLLIQSVKRFKVKQPLSESPHLVVEASYLEDLTEKSDEMDALTRSVVNTVKKLSELNPFFTEEMKLAMLNAPNQGTIADLVAFSLALPKIEAQNFLETLSVKERFQKLLIFLQKEQKVTDIQKKIQNEVNTKINSLQREFFLKEQLKTIKKELGVEVDGKEKLIETFRSRIEASKMSDDVKKIAYEELDKFETLSEQSPEHNLTRNYLEILCSLPWGIETTDNLNLNHARSILDEDHYGLKKVKERIVEFIAIRNLKNRFDNKEKNHPQKGAIICLVGPPGVGKTSIGKSIAKSLERNFYRFSLGGMRDEAEIKGHRRTYIGALPGKIIQALKRAESSNAVILLDEIDKIGQSFHGDPSSALLEVLDPEQNHSFLDHYLDIPFDLSKVLFIATANTTSTIPTPLLDRMEVIELPGYTLEEKEAIATQYLIPKTLQESGLHPRQIKIDKSTLKEIIQKYAREPGVRSLEQILQKISRKAATQIIDQIEAVEGSRSLTKFKSGIICIEKDELREWIGPERFYNEISERITTPGVSTGLAWTSHGGDILFIEATQIPGTGQLKLTGKMGEVMTESATIAWSYVKKRLIEEKKLKSEDLKSFDIHLHIPAGAIPKDGPSAGITMASALYSLMTKQKINHLVAMTGELSLIGKVLPVGGIKEKALAAHRSGVKIILLPERNEKDLEDLREEVRNDIEFKLVSNIDDVFKFLFESKTKKKPLVKKTVRAKKIKKNISLKKPKRTFRKSLRIL